MRALIVIAVHKSDLEKVDKAVMMALAVHCHNKTGQCNPSIQTLCRSAGWGRTAVMQACSRLEKRGCLTIEKVHRNSNKYVIHIDRLDSSSPGDGLLNQASSPPRRPHQSATQTPVVRETDPSSPPDGPQVRSEVKQLNVNSEVAELDFSIGRSPSRSPSEKPLPEKVDDILTQHAELVSDKDGKVDVRKLARIINQRDGRKKNVEPSERLLRAVEKCVQHHYRDHKHSQGVGKS